MNASNWTPERLDILRARYAREGGEKLAAEWGLNARQVCNRAQRLGLRIDEERAYSIRCKSKAQLWTPDKLNAESNGWRGPVSPWAVFAPRLSA